jgi:hypothetical protein
MGPQEIEHLRRSVHMLPEGHSASLTKQAVRTLLEEVAAARDETARHRQAVGDLRRVPDTDA